LLKRNGAWQKRRGENRKNGKTLALKEKSSNVDGQKFSDMAKEREKKVGTETRSSSERIKL